MAEKVSFHEYQGVFTKRWKTLLLVALVAVILSAVLSGPTFITPKYRSYAICYPVNIQSYSVETRTDQLLQLLGSNSIRDSLIQKFDLATHYEVDSMKPGGKAMLYNEFNDRVEVSKTRYESVLIEVMDEDPLTARDMVEEMIRQVDLLARRLQREKSNELLVIAEKAMHHEKHKLDSVEIRLQVLSKKYGLLAYESQTKELVKGYVKVLGNSGQKKQQEEISNMINELQERGGEYNMLTGLSAMFRANYDNMLSEYESRISDVTKELSYTNVIVYPEISDKKAYPIRWLIVLIGTLAAAFLAFVLMLIQDQRKANA